jgi:subtilisin family serine protease
MYSVSAATACSRPALCEDETQLNLGDEFFDKLVNEMKKEAEDWDLSKTLFVNSFSNCFDDVEGPEDLNASNLFYWPGEIEKSQNPDSLIVVTGTEPLTDPRELIAAAGNQSVDIAAPANQFQVLAFDNDGVPPLSLNFCPGTSFAAPLVSGTLALIQATDPAAFDGAPDALRDRLLCNASIEPELEPFVNGGRFLADRKHKAPSHGAQQKRAALRWFPWSILSATLVVGHTRPAHVAADCEAARGQCAGPGRALWT